MKTIAIRVLPALLLLSCSVLPAPKREDAELQQRADRVLAEVSKLRGLAVKQGVPAGAQNKADVRTFMEQETEQEWARSGQYTEREWKALGLIPKELDLKREMLDFLESEVGGYYDPEKKRFFTVSDAVKEGDGDEVRTTEDFVLAHELTHAIDDQHFDLKRLDDERMANSDARDAFSNLVEGSANEGGAEQVICRLGIPASSSGPTGRSMVKLLSWAVKESIGSPDAAEFLSDGNASAAKSFEESPPIIRDPLFAHYTVGWELANRLRGEFGWDAIDQAYADPPESTEQVFFPERYIDRRDHPVAVALPAAPNGWRAVHEDTLGYLGTRIFLTQLLDGDAGDDASGWDGDRYVLWETGSGDALGWVSVWDREGDAESFEDDCRTLLGLHHGPSGPAGTWSIQRSGDTVAIAMNAPQGSADSAATALLSGAKLTRAPDDQAPDTWYGNLARWPISMRFLDRVAQFRVLGGLGIDGRWHSGGHRVRLIDSLLLHSENNPDRTGFWVLCGLAGFATDEKQDFSLARIDPFLVEWHGRSSGDDRRSKFSLALRAIDYERTGDDKQFDLLWGLVTRVKWGPHSTDGRRLRILFIPIPGI